jgi:GAF domain-containing protein
METIIIPSEAVGKADKYESLLPQIKSLTEGETDTVANMANIAAALKESMGFFWVGFYTLKGDDLVLSPFQGPPACTRIRGGRGVCGTARMERRTVIVPDVDLFPGHIACSSASRSEIVVPFFDIEGNVRGVLDIDSDSLNTFDDVDAFYLERIVSVSNLAM